jgi:hypothetical protein
VFPCAAFFPQTAQFRAEELEPQFHNVVDSKGERVKVFYTNKGL